MILYDSIKSPLSACLSVDGRYLEYLKSDRPLFHENLSLHLCPNLGKKGPKSKMAPKFFLNYFLKNLVISFWWK